jgi:hypothetical protein
VLARIPTARTSPAWLEEFVDFADIDPGFLERV